MNVEFVLEKLIVVYAAYRLATGFIDVMRAVDSADDALCFDRRMYGLVSLVSYTLWLAVLAMAKAAGWW